MKIGVLIRSQASSWPAVRQAAIAVDEAGLDSIWTWDHLLGVQGPSDLPIFEGWTMLTGVASVTQRATIGLLVGANTFRPPGLTSKLAATLDHVSDGRAILGLGGAWFEEEHRAFGIDFGSSVGERLDRLDEAAMLCRRLLDGERITHNGRHYQMTDAICRPRPVQDHLPIMIGGSGPKKTLRTVARYASLWNTSGTPEDVRASTTILERHCAEVGRRSGDIERTIAVNGLIRDDAATASAHYDKTWVKRGLAGRANVMFGDPQAIAAQLRPYLAEGFSHAIFGLREPFDLQTIEGLAEVKSLLTSDTTQSSGRA